jgi:hypothetical protein
VNSNHFEPLLPIEPWWSISFGWGTHKYNT